MSYEFRGNTRAKADAGSGRRPAASKAPKPARASAPGRSPLQTFAAIMGAVFLLLGVGGFIPGVTQNYDGLEFSGRDSTAELLGIFQVSVLHNILHLLFAVGLLAAARYSWSRAYLLGGALGYFGLTLYGAFIDRSSDANFVPVNDADTVLHLVLGLGMLALALIGMRLSEGTPATRY
jgi:hypothetical protein